jgi:uncharacterized membrane protein (GlpM family)
VSEKIVELVVKAVAAGLLVVAFAVLAETLKPKRLAGVLSAVPSVGLASLVVTAGFSGQHDVAQAARGMIVGAVAFVVYCLAAVPLVGRWGAWRGSVAALLAWGSVAAVGGLLWL